MKLSIIVPLFNEEKTIATVLTKLSRLKLRGWNKEVIIVDDGSTDGSLKKIQNSNRVTKSEFAKDQNNKAKLKIFRKGKNQGKGAAIKSGLQYAIGDYVLIQDADNEYNPADIPKLLQKIKTENAKVVYGTRNVRPKRRGYFLYVIGDLFLTSITNLLYSSRLTDLYTGYKLFETKLLRSLKLESKGFEFEAEVTTKILKKGIKIVEVPISYCPRTFAEGKKIGLKDAIIGLATILKNVKT